MNNFLDNIRDHISVVRQLQRLNEDVLRVAEILVCSLRKGGKIMFCGNGGSAADCQHLAAEFTGRFLNDRRPLAAIALSTDTSALTCIGNDYGFDQIFSRQVVAIGSSSDVLVGISTSGMSRNIIRAVQEARSVGIRTIGLLGRGGGELKGLCDDSLVVPSEVTARIQECHILIGHTLCEIVELKLGLIQK